MRTPRQAVFSLHLAVLLFGVAGLIGKVVTAPALVVTCVRSLVACLVLSVILGLRRAGGWSQIKTYSGMLVFTGAVLAAHWWTFFAAIQHSTVALGLLTFASYPLFVSLLGWLAQREPMRRAEAAACGLVVVGLALVVPDWRFGSQAGLAAGCGIFSGFLFAVLTLFNRHFTAVLSPLLLVAAQTGVAGLILLPLAGGRLAGLDARDWLWLVVLGVVFTGVAHACFTASLAGVRISTVGVTTALEPVYGIAFAWWLLGERPSLKTALGAALIIGAAVVVARRQGPAPGDTAVRSRAGAVSG
jgi:drug/metabolite transporter (DMT)-like permease